MIRNSNKRIVGAFIVGLALVGLAYTVGSLNTPPPTQTASLVTQAPVRTAINVTDTDNNGIEDWRDSYVVAEPIAVSTPGASYEPPETLTGQLGVNFFQNIISARNSQPFGRTDAEVIEDTANLLAEQTAVKLYDIPNISILDNWTDDDIRNYANAMAGIMVRNNVADSDDEISILYDVVRLQQAERVSDLEDIAAAYSGMRDESLEIPVPRIFVKQHLDLINTYNSLAVDIEAMTESSTDPTVAILRIRRYQEDALGLRYALENMYYSIEPYSNLFTKNDTATIFGVFNPNNQL